MDIRKIVVVGGLAIAALASAPLASADDPLTPIVDSEISSLNSLFELDAAIAGDSGDVTLGGTGVVDLINPADAPATTPLTFLDYELYGPLANLLTADFDAEPGASDVFFGALAEFDDAFNAAAYLVLEDSAQIPVSDLLSAADVALDDGSLGDGALFATFFDTGVTDILSYFGAVWLS